MDNYKNRARLIDLACRACACKLCQIGRAVSGIKEPTLDERADVLLELRNSPEAADTEQLNALWAELPARERYDAQQRAFAKQRDEAGQAREQRRQSTVAAAPQWAQLKAQLEAQHMDSVYKTIVYGLVDLAEEIWKNAINE